MRPSQALLPSAPALLSFLLLGALALPAPAQKPAQVTTLDPLPPGITLPISLGQTLHAGETRAGTAVSARTTQRILLPGNLFLKRGAELLGTVDTSSASPATLSLHFTSIRYRGHSTPLRTRTLAVAAFYLLSDTLAPSSGATDRANSNPANWTTRQIGGDEVARTQWTGPVLNSSTQTVGFADFHGVYANPISPSTTPRALGPFSSSSRGLAGYAPDCALTPAPTSAVQCATSSLTLHSGDALLLEVLPQQP